MKKTLLLLTLGLFLSCSNVQNPDYERNLEITKEWFETFGDEDLDNTMSYCRGQCPDSQAGHPGYGKPQNRGASKPPRYGLSEKRRHRI